jgi:RHS repeat-associated protein
VRIVGATAYSQTIATNSNRLLQNQTASGTATFSYDNAGNMQGDGVATYVISDRGRMSSATVGANTVVYKVNGLEQRVSKTGPTAVVPTGAAYYTFDEAGQLVGEYDANLSPLYETVYLGSTPVGVLKQSGSAAASSLQVVAYNVWADHLATPRVVTRGSDQAIVWRWDASEPFGATAADQNPNALGTFAFNQRFPGQVFDSETGNFQNWHRDYKAGLGRYAQSDPIGLQGGINTYQYASGNPLSLVDPMGLATCVYSVSSGRMDCMRNGSEKFTWSGTFASGNNKEAGCKNNSNCESKEGIGPTPRGCWAWSGPGSSAKPGGRALSPLAPLQSRPFGRDLFRTHSCDYPFGPSLGPKVCSAGCVTGTQGTVEDLNDLIDLEPSVLCVVD